MKKISVITAVYNEESTVKEVYEVIKKVFESYAGKYDYEHIFLDNCSSDNTLKILKETAARDKRVKALSYSKNFGPVKSGYVGYWCAGGDALICYEANLKDPPELIHVFIKRWEEGYDVIYGVRNRTKDNPLMLLMRKAFYRTCNIISVEPLPENAGVFRLVDRKIIDQMKKIDDYKPYERGLVTSIGFKQIGVYYERRARARGKSKSNPGYLVDFAINAFVSYSILPIRLCTYLGIFLSGVSFLIAVIYILLKLLLWNIQAPGIATVIVLVLFFSGVQLFFLGVIGEYVGAIHSQVRRKPFVVIREGVNFAQDALEKIMARF